MPIRFARPADAPEIAEIYRPFVEDTEITYETAAPDAVEMAARVAKTAPRPFLVLEEGGRVLGYSYAGPHRERAAYRWTVETSIYVHADARRTGAGTALLRALLGLLSAQGYGSALAGILVPHPASVGLHESLGFKPVGVYRNVGYKFGRWSDVGWWEYPLPSPSAPADPTPVSELSADLVAEILSGNRRQPV